MCAGALSIAQCANDQEISPPAKLNLTLFWQSHESSSLYGYNWSRRPGSTSLQSCAAQSMLKLHVFRGSMRGQKIHGSNARNRFKSGRAFFYQHRAKSPADQNQYANYVGRPKHSDDRREQKGPPRGFDRPRDRGPRRQGGDRPQRVIPLSGSRRGGTRCATPPPAAKPWIPDRKLPPPPPLVEVNCSFIPDDRGVSPWRGKSRSPDAPIRCSESLRSILQKPERYQSCSLRSRRSLKAAPFSLCCLRAGRQLLVERRRSRRPCPAIGISIHSIRRNKRRPNRPRGLIHSSPQCGISGQILGPPQLSRLPNQFRKLHGRTLLHACRSTRSRRASGS